MSGAPPPPTVRPLGGLLGSTTHVLWARLCGCGGPTLSPWPACPVGAACRAGGGGPSPGGAAFHRCGGRLRSGAPPPPTARPLGGLLGSATRVLRARACGCGGPSRSPWPACPVGAACRGGGGGPSPRGVACHRCEGRLVSGAVPPPAVRPLGRAGGVPRPVCPGCGRWGRGTQHRPHSVRPCGPALLTVGVAEGRSRGVPSTIVRGVCGQALPLPELPAHWAGCWGPPPTCCGRGHVGVGAHHGPLGLHALWGLRAAGQVGSHPREEWPATVVRGVWCQALSLPRPPVLWGGQPGLRDPCVPGAVRAGVGPSTSPTACALAGRRCSLLGWRKCVPGGVPSTVPGGVCGQVLPLPELPAHWAACSGPPPTYCGRGRVGVGAQHCLLGLHALWGLRAAGLVGGPPRGGWPATVVRGVWCQALSLPRPPVLWGGQPGFCDPCVPGAIGAGVGTQHRPHSVRPCGPALLAVAVAEGHPRRGCPPPL